MASSSILFGEDRPEVIAEPPPFFGDLNLDQLVAAITAGRDEYDLLPFFYTPLATVDAVEYRHAVLRDLEGGPLLAHVGTFAERMRAMRRQFDLIAKLHYRQQRERWFLDAVRTYCDAVAALAQDLKSLELSSRGVIGVREHVERYVASEAFLALDREERDVRERLARVAYTLEIDGSRVKVARYEGEDDYGIEVAATFEKFKQGAVKDYRPEFSKRAEMNHVEAGVLERVALLYPDTFEALRVFSAQHRDFVDETVATFDREVQFYLAYLEFVERLRRAGLTFCYPSVSERSKSVCAREAFDVALADKLVAEGTAVVTNDFRLEDPERIFVVSGPNQGGKTTFARTFGQMHHLATLGCLVPGTGATLFLCDHVFTHFEKEEKLEDLSGKLQDDLLRVRDILERVTTRSVVILNEIFTSTTLSDAAFLGTKVLEEVIEREALCVCVTFVEELSTLDESVVSMVSSVDPDDPAVRTFKVVRRPADGLSHAVAIAEKYGLTYDRLKERVAA